MKTDILPNENADLCSKCKGRCCKSLPGTVYPSELGATHEAVRDGILVRLKTGVYSLDYWEGDLDGEDTWPQIYFLRPSTVKSKGKTVDPSWGGQCVLLTKKGCPLLWAERPLGCRALVPAEGYPNKCHGEGATKRAGVVAWRPWQHAVKEALRILGEED